MDCKETTTMAEQWIVKKQQWLNNVFKETTMAEQCI